MQLDPTVVGPTYYDRISFPKINFNIKQEGTNQIIKFEMTQSRNRKEKEKEKEKEKVSHRTYAELQASRPSISVAKPFLLFFRNGDDYPELIMWIENTELLVLAD